MRRYIFYVAFMVVTLTACDSASQQTEAADEGRQTTTPDGGEVDGVGGDTEVDGGQTTTPDGGGTDMAGGDAESDGEVDGGGGEVPRVVFPIEVFGEAGHMVSAPLRVMSDGATSLYLKVHRPTWIEDGSYALRHPKMSVRLDQGEWFTVQPQQVQDWSTWGTPAAGAYLFPMQPTNVTCLHGDGQFGGCMAGTYHTVRFAIALDSLGEAGPGLHTLTFRFEGTDGISMGFRVLDLDLRNEAGQSVLNRAGFTEEDVDTWQPPFADAASIEEGRQLWREAPLLKSPIDPTPINARCASCHATDGRDLAYFNFSTYSIVRRSEFHGLTTEQGEKIASYIRTLDLGLPGLRKSELGRPWNPPYQPGVGLDARPVARWAAGAGLEAVLNEDAEMGEWIFPSTGTPLIASAPSPGGAPQGLTGANGYLNPRETPQAIQFPDWNAWLPLTAPEDLTVDPMAIYATDWFREFEALDTLLTTQRDTFLYQDLATHTQSQANTFRLYQLSSGFPGTSTNNGVPTDVMIYKDAPNGLDWKTATTFEQSLVESRAVVAMKSWRNMRKWELFHRHNLEQLEGWRQTLWLYVSPPGMRVWPTSNRDMFEIGPHFGGPGYPLKVRTFNDTPIGTYWTTVWYTLQQVVNGGYQAMAVTGPVDWNYQVPHIGGTPRYGDAWPSQPFRSFWGTQFMMQAIPLESNVTDFDWPIGHLGDALSSGGADAASVLRNDALARSFIGVVQRYAVSDWPRKVGDGSFEDKARFDPPDTAPNQSFLDDALASPYLPDVIASECHQGWYANCFYLRLRSAHASQSLSQDVLNEVLDWMESIWPLYAWDAMRN